MTPKVIYEIKVDNNRKRPALFRLLRKSSGECLLEVPIGAGGHFWTRFSPGSQIVFPPGLGYSIKPDRAKRKLKNGLLHVEIGRYIDAS